MMTMMIMIMFVIIIRQSLHETIRIDAQWVLDYAIKFTTWQHAAIGLGLTYSELCYLAAYDFKIVDCAVCTVL